MSYKTYRAGVERRKAALQAELTRANDLRRASYLPTRDIEAELGQQCPLLTEEAWTAQRRELRTFARFKREGLAGMVMPSSPAGADWEQVRAVGLRKVYLEHQIQLAWLTKRQSETSTAAPRET